jgi:hypothetical protein
MAASDSAWHRQPARSAHAPCAAAAWEPPTCASAAAAPVPRSRAVLLSETFWLKALSTSRRALIEACCSGGRSSQTAGVQGPAALREAGARLESSHLLVA